MEIKIIKDYKSIRSNDDSFELPDFTVLMGKNGSGKSHLLEALSNEELSQISDKGEIIKNVKTIPFNGLNPNINPESKTSNLEHERDDAWSTITRAINAFKQYLSYSGVRSFDTFLRSNNDYGKILKPWYELMKGNLEQLTEQFFSEHYSLSNTDFFSNRISDIFVLYHDREEENNYNEYRNNNFGETRKYLSQEDFQKTYGPKPWNLINSILSSARLPYAVNNPESNSHNVTFHLFLKDKNTGTEININDLSTGEKVLMSLALSIYNSRGEFTRPELLCIDEPDAALHPEYSRFLIEAIKENIVDKANVKVIITTHSPTTVAMAPENSIFLMNKSLSRPEKITKKQAIKALTNDIDNLRVSIEDRRPVFVENKNDAEYYNKIFGLVKEMTTTTPTFLTPRSGNGCNCNDVEIMVKNLRESGNDLIYGIIDYDLHNKTKDGVLVLGEGNRYAIDNYIFDPIYVAFLLIELHILTTQDMHISENYTFTHLRELSDSDIQSCIDYVCQQLNLNTHEQITYTVQSGKTFSINKDMYNIQGHELEKKIKDKWPKVNAIASKEEKSFKIYMLDKIIREYPEYLSIDFPELFRMIQ